MSIKLLLNKDLNSLIKNMKLSKISQTVPWLILGIFLIASFLLMFNASQKESATMDELAHIPAGYGYVRYLDYRLNPEHPPLVKAIAAFPLIFQKLNFPTDKFPWQKDINGQWAAGAQFLYESGNDADKIIQWARLGPMLLTLILITFIYLWAKELMGRWWALLPTFLFAFSPNVLAHGHYVTTDIGAALGIFIASYYFIKFLLQPTKRHLIFSGITFGIAQLMKFSAVLLIPFFAFLILIFYFWKIYHSRQKYLSQAFKYFKALVIIFLIGYSLVYIVYLIFTLNYPIEKQITDTKFILTSFAGGPDQNWQSCKLTSNIPLKRHARCLAEIDIWIAQNKILRPLGHYLLGVLMVFQRSSGGNTAYFLGEVSAAGWWYYFPVVFLLKEPLPSLILIVLALILAIWRIIKNIKSQWSKVISHLSDYIGTHFAEFSMLIFIILYWAYSMNSPLNIGVRHILPTIPFIYILTISGLKKWTNKKIIFNENLLIKFFSFLNNFLRTSLKIIFIFGLLVFYLIETILAKPYFLSYFNELAGGIENGYKYVTDSNYDWGQDLKRLKSFIETWNLKNETKINKIAIDYFGGGNPKYYLGDCSENSHGYIRIAEGPRPEARYSCAEYWRSAKGNPKEQGIEWLAISINNLQGALGRLHPGQNRNPEDEYRWLKEIKNPYQPDFKAGTSIFIYKL